MFLGCERNSPILREALVVDESANRFDYLFRLSGFRQRRQLLRSVAPKSLGFFSKGRLRGIGQCTTDQLHPVAVNSAKKPLEQVEAPGMSLLIGSQNTLNP